MTTRYLTNVFGVAVHTNLCAPSVPRAQDEIAADAASQTAPAIQESSARGDESYSLANLGSPYVPLVCWVQPAIDRLAALSLELSYAPGWMGKC
jgi:hypothetical protein